MEECKVSIQTTHFYNALKDLNLVHESHTSCDSNSSLVWENKVLLLYLTYLILILIFQEQQLQYIPYILFSFFSAQILDVVSGFITIF